MRRIRILVVMLGAWLLSAQAAAAEGPRVVATFTVLGDFVAEVAGDRARVDLLTPAGAEVHEWELTARNFAALERADAVFYNGYGLEQWMRQVRATVRDGVPLIPVAEESGHPTQPIITGELEGQPDPHLWMDVSAARAYVRAIAKRLADLDPDGAEVYRANAEAYDQELRSLDKELRGILGGIPEERRVLITSEAAFGYFADAYDFVHDGVWGTNAEEEGTPRQLMRVIDIVRERQPPVVFWESTISDRHVRTVATETGVSVAGPLYVDSVGTEGSGARTYTAMMRANAELLRRHLGGEAQ